jgi:hypothetical protein
MQTAASSIPLLVVSCDKYADVWPFFFSLFRIRWPDCPYPVLLGSNQLSAELPGVTNILIGPDLSWSTGVVKMLDRVLELYPNANYVLIFLEDFFIESQVNTARIVDLARIATEENVGCLRLVAGLPLALPPTYDIPKYPGLGVIAQGEQYRVTLQASIWRIDTLRRFLAPGLNAWEFEQIGTQMSYGLDDTFWGVTSPAINYDHAVEKGKWKPAGLAILRGAGLPFESLEREVFTIEELAAHFKRSQVESEVAKYRNYSLRSFLIGQRKEGLVFLMKSLSVSGLSFHNFVLSCVGLLGATVTRFALALYVKYRLFLCARREQNMRD